MQAGTLASSDAQVFTSRVLVNGTERPHKSWSVDRELAGDMPDQVVAGSGITQATGRIQWPTPDDVTERAVNPWNTSTGWLPRIGDRVQIFAGDTVTEWVQFTGRIDKTTGSLVGGATSTLIDDYDKLSAPVSHLPLLRIMPPLENGDPYRGVGLSSIHYVDHAFRTAGFYSTPPTEYDPAVAVSCQGSMWPNSGAAGTLVSGGAYGGVGSHHSNNAAPWGWSVGNFQNTYRPRVTYPSTTPVQLTAMVAPDHAGAFFLTAYYGASNTAQLAVTASRVAILRVNGTEACRVSLGAGTVATALLKGGVVTLKTNAGATATGSATIGGTAMSSVLTSGDVDTRIAGIQVSHPATAGQEFSSTEWAPNAFLELSRADHIGLIDAAPSIDATPASDLVSEISKSTLSGWWIDEAGNMQWVPTVALRDRAPSKTVTTLDDIFELSWEDSLLGSRSKVTVEGKIPSISKSTYRSVGVYRGSGGSLASEELQEDIVGPDGDEDWIMPDEDLTVLPPWSQYNVGLSTFGGFYYTNGGDVISSAGLTSYVSFVPVGLTKYRIRHRAGVLPAGVEAQIGTHPTQVDLWPRNRGKDLPVIKAFGRVKWADVKVTPITAGGIGPELVHDAGVWNNRADDNTIIERVASYLASQTANPLPVITGLTVAYDPRTQLGDVVTISSPKLLGVTMRALIVEINNADDGKFTQSLSVRLISADIAEPTWAQFEEVHAGKNYQQLETLWNAKTYADLEADPLKVSA